MDINDIIKDDKLLTQLLRELVKGENPIFQHRVALCYRRGNGIEKNDTEAFKWSVLAAEHGHAAAQYNLGRMYHFGFGTQKNVSKAVELYTDSANQKYGLAQHSLAGCYENGWSVAQNYAKAIELYELSSEQGNWRASESLGDMYRVGRGVKQDWIKAKVYYKKARSESEFWEKAAGDEDIERIDKKIKELANGREPLNDDPEPTRHSRVRTDVFISYAHMDAEYIEELRPHLNMAKKSLNTKDNFKYWDDSHIKSGQEWDKEIKEALSTAKIAVLLVSANYFNSEYINLNELPEILKMAKKDGATILWMPVSACDYEDTEIAKYQAVGDSNTPLEECSRAERNKVYTELVKRIKKLFKTQAAS